MIEGTNKQRPSTSNINENNGFRNEKKQKLLNRKTINSGSNINVTEGKLAGQKTKTIVGTSY